MNVYLAPIIKELIRLWEKGVWTKDNSIQLPDQKLFLLKAILLFVMHDFPGYGIASSLQTQGFRGCPPCGPFEVPSYSAKELGKIIFHGHRKFLPPHHMWRSEDYNHLFNGEAERSTEPPKRWNGWDWLAAWGQVEEGSLHIVDSGMKALSKFYDLEYWAVIKNLYPNFL